MKKIIIGMLAVLTFNTFANDCETLKKINLTTLNAASVVQAHDLDADSDFLFTMGFKINKTCNAGESSDELVNSYCLEGRKVVAEVVQNISILAAQGSSTANEMSFGMLESAWSLKELCEK